jgi:pimeloyl-ACP methyl ester carboxylesterase
MTEPENSKQCVILLHGLARTSLSMKQLEKALSNEGYVVVNLNYPSTRMSIDELSDTVIDDALKQCRQFDVEQINFVTHSLGGILVRHYTQQRPVPGLKRVVMLGPPNQGSEVVDKLKHVPGFAWWNGPAGLELGTSEEDVPRKLKPVDFELGVIAGKRSVNMFLSLLLPGEDDGKVSVESTRVEGMADFITLPSTHTFMMLNPETIRQTLYFLEHGRFNHQ